MAAILLASGSAVEAASGDLDSAFGVGGKVTTDFGGSDTGYAVAVQADGKIVAAGGTGGDWAIARYNKDGTIDFSFGGGKVITQFGVGAQAGIAGLVLQADGKIVAAGHAATSPNNFDFALARYNSDGSLDVGFGSGGKVLTDFGDDSDAALRVAMGSDGTIVAAGRAGAGSAPDFALARYNPDGSLDTGFGSGGKVTTDFGGVDLANGLALQIDGKIVVAGGAGLGVPQDARFALARYNPAGSLDTSFGSAGKVTTDFGSPGAAQDVVLQSNGKIVSAGWANGGLSSFALARYNPDGSLDIGFGSGGRVITTFPAQALAYGVSLQQNGKIVAAGSLVNPGTSDFALARYKPNGGLDSGFGISGKVTTNFGGIDQAQDLALQLDGKIVAAGFGGNSDFALARYQGDPVLGCKGHPATIVGTSGDDTLVGTSGDDVIVGLAGKDAIDARGGRDVLCGNGGNDTLLGDVGDDSLYGGAGDDTLDGSEGSDRLYGGGGVDICGNGEIIRGCEG
jgi:uncharacterized delta-60 repeat protein